MNNQENLKQFRNKSKNELMKKTKKNKQIQLIKK